MKKDLGETVFLERVAFQVRRPERIAKMHGGFMNDGTPMEDIKSTEDFWTHVLHTDGKEIANSSFSLVEELKEAEE